MTMLHRRTFILGGLAAAGSLALPARAARRHALPVPARRRLGRAGRGQRGAVAGTARHADVQVAAGGAAPSIGIDDRANVAAGSTVGGLDGWAQGLEPDGTLTGRLPAQTLTQTTTGRQDQLPPAESAWGELAVAYTDDSDGNGFTQVLLGWARRTTTGAGSRSLPPSGQAGVQPAVRVQVPRPPGGGCARWASSSAG
ncbi:hypothetical protein ODJ79_02920 [Actinoplanes sp. KI2]|uniref:hypothetical protein n=1 Tax=Actinoplanes sp. KI2 TaxID=2983315 RepID=UPI0021D5BAD7|nr:hypothetical protein [Actinoplanes sp. KI2]MCU7722657.1 hypothetical protein [Actinoplanes sp. KI2]